MSRVFVTLAVILAGMGVALGEITTAVPSSMTCWTSGSLCIVEYPVMLSSGTSCASNKVALRTSHAVGPNLAKIGATAVTKKKTTDVETLGTCILGPDGIQYPVVTELRIR